MADGAGEDSEAGNVRGLVTGLEEQLVADADAEERPVGGDPGLDGLPESGLAEIAGTVAEGALAGNDEGVAGLKSGGFGDVSAGTTTTLGGLKGTAEIAAAVVDDADLWSVVSYW